MLPRLLQRIPPVRDYLYRAAEPRAVDTLGHFAQYLRPGERILDVGCGMGNVALLLEREGYTVTALDVANLSFNPQLTPILYDGEHMPFTDKQFDTALIATVLHHVPASHQETVLRESMRVAKRLIIIEDVHTSRTHKYVTMFMDSMFNLEFIGHPHSNKSDTEWRAEFKRLGLKVAAVKPVKSFLVLRHQMYLLEQS